MGHHLLHAIHERSTKERICSLEILHTLLYLRSVVRESQRIDCVKVRGLLSLPRLRRVMVCLTP